MNPAIGADGLTWPGWAGINGLPLPELPTYEGAFLGHWIANKLKRGLFSTQSACCDDCAQTGGNCGA